MSSPEIPPGRISGGNKLWFSEVTVGRVAWKNAWKVYLRSHCQQPYTVLFSPRFLTFEGYLDSYLFLKSSGHFRKIPLDCFTTVSVNSTGGKMYGLTCQRKQTTSSHIVNLDPAFILKNFDSRLAWGDTGYMSFIPNLFSLDNLMNFISVYVNTPFVFLLAQRDHPPDAKALF